MHVNIFKKTDKRIRKITSKPVEKKDGLRKNQTQKEARKKRKRNAVCIGY